MICSICNSEMIPMITSCFCPNDCDRSKSKTNGGYGGFWKSSKFHSKMETICNGRTRAFWTSEAVAKTQHPKIDFSEYCLVNKNDAIISVINCGNYEYIEVTPKDGAELIFIRSIYP